MIEVTEEQFINAITAAYNDLKESVPTENVAVAANEGSTRDTIKKESKMDEMNETACGTSTATAELNLTSAEEKPETKPVTETEDKKEDTKGEGEDKKDEKKDDKPFGDKPEGEDKKKEVKEADFKKAEDLLKKVLEHEKAEQAGGEAGEEEDIKNIEEAMKALGMKAKEEKPEGLGDVPPAVELDAPVPPAGDVPPAADLASDVPPADLELPGASLVATFEKKATIADSVWLIKNASDNSDYLSFNVKAAFGANIDNDEARSAYATSEAFGKDVVAALINEKVASAVGAKAAVLGVVAHYSPSHASSHKFADFPAANPGASGTKVETETDKNLVGAKKEAAVDTQLSTTAKAKDEDKKEDKKCKECGKEKCECDKKDVKKKANEAAEIEKTAAVEGVTSEALGTDASILPDVVKVSEDENNKQDKSAVAYQGPKITAETDRKVIASMEETIKKQASEINALKLQASVNEKAAKVKEAVSLMVRAGLIKGDEQVRIAALKDGLSIEAASAKGMAASIDAQSKNLFGMNTPQLDSYIKSLAALTPRAKTVQAESMQPLNVKASAVESEADRLAKILGWD